MSHVLIFPLKLLFNNICADEMEECVATISDTVSRWKITQYYIIVRCMQYVYFSIYWLYRNFEYLNMYIVNISQVCDMRFMYSFVSVNVVNLWSVICKRRLSFTSTKWDRRRWLTLRSFAKLYSKCLVLLLQSMYFIRIIQMRFTKCFMEWNTTGKCLPNWYSYRISIYIRILSKCIRCVMPYVFQQLLVLITK